MDADDGCTFGERGEPRAGVVPRPRQRGRGAPALADVDLRPCAARDQHVVYLSTIIADDGDDELLRCRGHPTKGQPSVLWSSPQVGVAREGGPPARPRRDSAEGAMAKAEPASRDGWRTGA